MSQSPLEPDYDYQMNLWAGQIYLERALTTIKQMLELARPHSLDESP